MRASQESIAILRARARGLFGVALARADPAHAVNTHFARGLFGVALARAGPARAVDTHFACNPFSTLPGEGEPLIPFAHGGRMGGAFGSTRPAPGGGRFVVAPG